MIVASPWLTQKEAAEYSRRSQTTVNNALRSGELPGSQTGPGGRWLIHRDSLDAWIRGEVVDPQPQRVTRRRVS